jgi:hypothetical protein
MFFFAIATVFALFSGYVSSQNFSLYPTVDPVKLATAFNISIDCLDALWVYLFPVLYGESRIMLMVFDISGGGFFKISSAKSYLGELKNKDPRTL